MTPAPASTRTPHVSLLRHGLLVLTILTAVALPAQQPHFSGPAAYTLTQQLLAAAPKRFNG